MITRCSVTNLARYAALLAAMFISFATQRHLALTHGVPDYASYAVPVAIDLFMIWAVRSRRDVALAVAVAVSANVAGVLTAGSLASVNTWVSAALHAVFPLTVWRMHREGPQVAAGEPETAVPVPVPIAPAIALPAPAESWPDADLWQDFEAASVATPPTAEDVRAVIADMGGRATGRMLADHYGVSERTGRRYLALAGESA